MRPLVTFFVLALIAAQFEYVTDASAFLAEHADAGVTVAFNVPNSDSDPDHEPNHDGCDHCCHGASHMTAIAVSLTMPGPSAIESFASVDPTGHTSLALTPPVPPPIA